MTDQPTTPTCAGCPGCGGPDCIERTTPAPVPAPDPLDDMTPQTCPAGVHADWAVVSEHTHPCPWCELAEAQQLAENMQGRAAAMEKRADLADRVKRSAAKEAAEALAALARVRDLHQQYRSPLTDEYDTCAHCNSLTGDLVPYPCDTVRALDGTARDDLTVTVTLPVTAAHILRTALGEQP